MVKSKKVAASNNKPAKVKLTAEQRKARIAQRMNDKADRLAEESMELRTKAQALNEFSLGQAKAISKAEKALVEYQKRRAAAEKTFDGEIPDTLVDVLPSVIHGR